MTPFMDSDFLLDSAPAALLYHEYAEEMPIIDYHNHINPADIAGRRRFGDLAELWLEGDHYKWRAMRACGVEERYITGGAEGYEKFLAWARVLPLLAGCPLYHWTHLELRRFFGIEDVLDESSAPAIWERTRAMLREDGFDAVSLLTRRRVRVLCTTDDPADALEQHARIAADGSFPLRVLPSFRPDKYLDAGAEGFAAAVARLGERHGLEIDGYERLEEALSLALERFVLLGCRVADHGFSVLRCGEGDPRPTFRKALAGQKPTEDELTDYQGALLRFLGRRYHELDMVMQLHLGPIRNVSPRLMSALGPDAGGDCVGFTTDPLVLGRFLGSLEAEGRLPKAILYNINPADNALLSTMAASFAPRVQYGAAWWFNDSLRGIERQLDELMETGQLARSVGMLTDSRSLTSFVRHEYFRRILCRRLGALVESGQYPCDYAALGRMVADVCYNNAKGFFSF